MAEPQFGGPWTEEKLSRLRKYLQAYMTIFTTNRSAKLLKTIYLDAFAGAGLRKQFSAQIAEEDLLFAAQIQIRKHSVREAPKLRWKQIRLLASTCLLNTTKNTPKRCQACDDVFRNLQTESRSFRTTQTSTSASGAMRSTGGTPALSYSLIRMACKWNGQQSKRWLVPKVLIFGYCSLSVLGLTVF
jgi:hypothetical protein